MNAIPTIVARTARRLMYLLLAAALGAGCASRKGVIFEPLDPPLAWPGPPEPDRVRYVGQLATSADLKPAVSLGQRVGSALFGKQPVQSMLSPYATCTDGRDRLFVADSNGQTVHVFNLDSRQYSQLRPANRNKRFTQPLGIAYDARGTLFVSDGVGGTIHLFTARGSYLGEIGQGIVQRPAGLAYDRQHDRLLVADPAAHQVVILARDGQLIARLGQRGSRGGEFNFPTNVAVDSRGTIYVSDSLNFRIQQFAPDLKHVREIGRKGDMPGYFGQPKGLALDSQDHLYVVDAHFEAVQVFDDQGRLLMDFGREGRKPGEFWLPAGIFIDPADRIWIADTYNRRVQVFDFVPVREQ
jgi:sugar lactone lactonase YvrE